MNPELKRSMMKAFALQFLAIFITSAVFGMEYTKPIAINSTDLPFMWLISRFFKVVPVTFLLPSSILLLVGIIFNPGIEEIVFRGPFYFAARRGWLNNLNDPDKPLFKVCFWLFAVSVNLRFFGFWHTNYSLPWQLTTGFIGLTLVWLVVKFKKIWPAVALHYVWNIILAGLEFYCSPYMRQELMKLIQ